jgi:hypothetical protein
MVVVRPRIHGKEQPGVPQVRVERFARHARFDVAIAVFVPHFDDPIHAVECHAHPAMRCRDVALERSACAERDHGHSMARAGAEDPRDFLGAQRPAHRIGRQGFRPCFAPAVLGAHRGSRAQSVAQPAAQFGDGWRESCRRRHGSGSALDGRQ